MNSRDALRSCLVCDSTEKRVIYRQPLVVPESGCAYSGYDVAVCGDCGFVYADNVVSQQALDSYYAGPTKVAQALVRCGDPEGDVERLNNSVRNVAACAGRQARILDIGCGTGRLLALLKEAGYGRLAGIDQSPVAAEIARDKYALDVRVASVFDYPERNFDCVTLCHVLEHIFDVHELLLRIYGLLNEGGVVYIEVPDVHQFARFADPASSGTWVYIRDLATHLSPEHINFFSPVSMRNLMTRFGFEEVFCESQPLGVVASAWRRRPRTLDREGERVFLDYTAQTEKLQSRTREILEELARSGEEVLVWGAGLHTQRLLGTGELKRVNIRAFVDADPVYRGTLLAGRPIISPAQVAEIGDHPPIVISSWKAQAAIANAIATAGLPNRTILLYPSR